MLALLGAYIRSLYKFGAHRPIWSPYLEPNLEPIFGASSELARVEHFCKICSMAGPGNDPVQGFRTSRDLHWEFLRLWTGFELSSSWRRLPCYGADLNRNILDFMR
jgi:hypothetical protein